MTQDLYTATDVKKVKEQLYKEQQGKCALTHVEVGLKDCHTDHAHDSEQLVRGALHKQANMGLGKLEGLWTRYLAYWYPGTLSDFLRQAADYIDREPDTRWRHPGWLKRVTSDFNKLKEPSKDNVLVQLGQPKGTNGKQRKELFRKAILTRSHGYDKIRSIIEKESKDAA